MMAAAAATGCPPASATGATVSLRGVRGVLPGRAESAMAYYSLRVSLAVLQEGYYY